MTDAKAGAGSGRSLLTPDRLRLVGIETDPYSLEVEKGDLVRFARATCTDNLLFTEEPVARNTRYGGLIAAPTYLLVMRGLEHQAFARLGWLPPANGVDGGSDWTYYQPIRPGDVITARAKIAELLEKEGKFGLMLFQMIDITYTNQFGELVVKQRDTRIYYQ